MTGPTEPRGTRAPDDDGDDGDPGGTRARARPARLTGPARQHARETFGAALYGARLQAGLTQRELAERMGAAESTIRDLERGAVRPSDRMCQRLGSALRHRQSLVAQAELELQLARAAGPNLLVYRRSRPPRVKRKRALEAARAEEERLVEAERQRRASEARVYSDLLDDALARARRGEDPVPRPPTAAEALGTRWPRVPPRRGR